MRTFVRLLSLLLVLTVSIPCLARNNEVEKTLKKQFKKVVYIESAGYYQVYNKQLDKWGVYSEDGRIIVPCKVSSVYYIDSQKIGDKQYVIIDKKNLYDMDGNMKTDRWKSLYKSVSILEDRFIVATEGEYYYATNTYYTIDFKLITSGRKESTVNIINFGGSVFLSFVSGEEGSKTYEVYSADGNMALKGSNLKIFKENGLELISVKKENGCNVAYYLSDNRFVPTFAESINKVKTIGGTTYYQTNDGLHNVAGENVFPYTILQETPHHYVVRNGYGKYGVITHDLKFVTQAIWNDVTIKQSGKYSWIFATATPSNARTWVKNHPQDFPTHIIDMKGNEYPVPGKNSLEGVRYNVAKGRLYVNNVAVSNLSPALLAYVPTADGSAAQANNKTQTQAGTPVAKDFPSLEMVPGSLRFVDNSGRNTIEANGKYAIEFEVKNNGKGLAKNCEPVAVIKSGGAGVTVGNASGLSLAPGAKAKVSIPLSSSMSTGEGKAEFAVKVNEPSGFGTDESLLSVTTHAFVEPKVLLSDYTVTSATGSTLKKKVPFDLQLLIQNVKHGEASDVEVSLTVPDNVYIIEGPARSKIPSLSGGQTKDMVYTIVANNEYASKTIPVQVRLKEKYGKYAENRIIELRVNQTLTASRITVDETARRPQTEITVARLNSDVDIDIPVSGRKSENTFAVIIANENYRQVAKVPQAANDGNIFRQYCINTLGIPERNIRHETDATLNDMKRQVNWLAEIGAAFGDKAEIIFYYSGHGVPDEASGQAYVLPVDGYHSDMSTNYRVDDLYATLSNTGAAKVTVFMDACFSGAQRGDGMLMSARGVQIKAKQNTPKGKMVVFSASQGDETAYPYTSQNHGLFTYFLLKKLRESGGKVTLGELGDYITDNVKRTSLVENSKSQTPQVLVSPVIATGWRDLSL